jgi:peptidoglycan/xylan/chitin deacetylase (PgdA/CDA1 family)
VPALVIVVLVFAAVYVVWRTRYGNLPAERPHVLCFHKISERFCWEGTWTTPRRFFAYVDRFQDLGYRFIGMDEYLDGMDDPADMGGAPENGPRLLLTFDDGYRELYNVVLPGLESRGISFHVFLVTDYVGRDNEWDLSLGRRPFRHLDWREIGEMAGRGVTFGSHGASHGDLTGMPRDRVRAELERSRTAIEEHLGRPPRALSYPFGRYNEVVKVIAREAGFEAAFSLYPLHDNSFFDPYAIRRSGVYVIDPVSLVETKVERGPLFWLEEMKCRAINSVAVLTPALKRLSQRGRDS